MVEKVRSIAPSLPRWLTFLLALIIGMLVAPARPLAQNPVRTFVTSAGGQPIPVPGSLTGGMTVTCVAGCGGSGGTAQNDNTALVQVTGMGALYDNTPPTITDGFVGAPRMDSSRQLMINCTAGCSGGTSDTDDGTIAGGQSTGLSLGLTQVYDGSNWKRLTIGTAGTASAQVLTIQGIASMTKLLVTPDLPSGASTAAKQPALGTAGSASTDVITIQGIASMTKLLVTPDSVALPANQSVNVAQINGVTTLMGNGASGTGAQRVTIANDSTGLLTVKLQDGSGNALTSNANGGTRAINVVVNDASGNAITAFSGSGGTASNFTSAIPSAGTAAGYSDGTNMQMARVADLDSGAGTVYGLVTNLVRRASGGPTEMIGSTTSALSLPVVIASDQAAVHIIADSGTITTVSAVTAITNALPAGSNVIGHVITDTGSTTAVTGTVTVGGLGASGATKSGNPVQIGGVFNTTQPTVTNGQTVEAQYTARGGAIVATGVDTFNVTINAAIAAGSNVIGHVIMDSGSTTVVTGTVAATQSGTWTVQPGNTANTTAWLVTGTGGTFPATESGTWTVQPGNTANTTAWLMKGGLSNNNAAPAATSNLGVLGYLANAAAPGNTEGDVVFGSVDLHGSTRVTLLDSSGAAITPSCDQTQNTAISSCLTGPGMLGWGSTATPTAAGADGRAQFVWLDLNGRVHNFQDVAQGSTTSGQTNQLMAGAVTTSSPTYTSGQTSPFSIDTAGSLRVSVVGGSSANPAACATGTSASSCSADYQGINVGSTLRGQTGVNYTGTSYAADENLAAIAGAVASVNNGTVDAGTLRVTLASNGTGVLATVTTVTTVGTVTAITGGGVASGATDSGNPLKIGGPFLTTQPTVTNGQRVDAQFTARGGMIISSGVDTVHVTVDAAPSTVVTATNLSTNVAQINGVTPLMGNGATGTGALRVSIANDSTGIIALTTGAAQIGHLEANQSVNVAQINGVTVLMGNGASGTGAQRVTIANDSTGILAGVTTVTTVSTVTSLSQLGGVALPVEDSAETANGVGIYAMTVRRDTAASSAGTTGDNSTLNTNASGALWTSSIDPCESTAKTAVPFSISTATTTQLVAASASNKVYICSVNVIASAAENVALIEDDTAACASPTAGMAGGTTAATGWNLAANGGLTLGNGAGTVTVTAATNRYVCLITSSTAQLSGTVMYALAP